MQFDKALQSLCDADVDFVVVGDHARSSTRRLVSALTPFHPRPRGLADLPFIWDEATLRNSTVLTLQTDIGEIDLLAEVAGLGSFEDVKRHSITLEAYERKVATLDLPGLIRAKRAAGREKDLSIIPELESLLESGRD